MKFSTHNTPEENPHTVFNKPNVVNCCFINCFVVMAKKRKTQVQTTMRTHGTTDFLVSSVSCFVIKHTLLRTGANNLTHQRTQDNDCLGAWQSLRD